MNFSAKKAKAAETSEEPVAPAKVENVVCHLYKALLTEWFWDCFWLSFSPRPQRKREESGSDGEADTTAPSVPATPKTDEELKKEKKKKKKEKKMKLAEEAAAAAEAVTEEPAEAPNAEVRF